MPSGGPGRQFPSINGGIVGRSGWSLRTARAEIASYAVRHLLHLEQLGEPSLQLREWRPVRRPYPAAHLLTDARTHQGSPRLCQRAMGFERGGIRVGSVERDAPAAGPAPS